MSKLMGPGWGAHATPVPGNILACLEELGINYSASGDEAQALCPNPDHVDRHPSWSVNIESGVHNCFSCGFKGPFVKLVETVLDVDRISAVAWCRKRGGVERARMLLDKASRKSIEPARVVGQRESDLALFTEPPLSACSKRLLTQEACREVGVLWDPAREMWITPIRDPKTGKLWGWQEKNERHFKNVPRNVRKSETLFGLESFQGGRAILIESPIDVARLVTVGVRGGLSSYGVHVSDKQLDIILRRADELVVALDNDEAGNRKSEDLRNSFRRIRLRFFNYEYAPRAKDVGEMTADQIKNGLRYATSRAVTRFE